VESTWFALIIISPHGHRFVQFDYPESVSFEDLKHAFERFGEVKEVSPDQRLRNGIVESIGLFSSHHCSRFFFR
jgi:hypothetical protein